MTDREFEMQVDRNLQESYTQHQKLERLVEKMIGIVRADTGASPVYADMLLSILPNSEHKVNIGFWTYKADSGDFVAMLEFMQKFRNSDLLFKYEALVLPYKEELKKYIGEEQ